MVEIVVPEVGGVKASGSSWIEGDEKLDGAPSVLSDAVARAALGEGRRGCRSLPQSLRQAAPLGSWRQSRLGLAWPDDETRSKRRPPSVGRIAEACLLYVSYALSGAYERARLPFLLTVTPVRPYPALTAGTRLLISAAKEGKDASPFNDFGKSPEEKPPPRR